MRSNGCKTHRNKPSVSFECDLTNHYLEGIDKLNAMAFNDGVCKLALHMDERTDAPNDVALDKHSKRLLKEYADPGCRDVIQIIKESLAEANQRSHSNLGFR